MSVGLHANMYHLPLQPCHLLAMSVIRVAAIKTGTTLLTHKCNWRVIILHTDIITPNHHSVNCDVYTLYNGDCLEIMPLLPEQSCDAIICDPPYGQTACAWDSVIPFAPMWECIKRLIKPRGAVVLFGSEPFSSLLRTSNLDWYKYDWVWEKSNATGHLDCNRKPMKKHESISVFANSLPNYYPQITNKSAANIRPATRGNVTSVYGAFNDTAARSLPADKTYPHTVLRFNSVNSLQRVHDTQKPVDLLAYLVETYTQAGDTVLDFTMGSGSTGVACMETGRNFIGIEMDANYFAAAGKRIDTALRLATGQPKLGKPTDYADMPMFAMGD